MNIQVETDISSYWLSNYRRLNILLHVIKDCKLITNNTMKMKNANVTLGVVSYNANKKKQSESQVSYGRRTLRVIQRWNVCEWHVHEILVCKLITWLNARGDFSSFHANDISCLQCLLLWVTLGLYYYLATCVFINYSAVAELVTKHG